MVWLDIQRIVYLRRYLLDLGLSRHACSYIPQFMPTTYQKHFRLVINAFNATNCQCSTAAGCVHRQQSRRIDRIRLRCTNARPVTIDHENAVAETRYFPEPEAIKRVHVRYRVKSHYVILSCIVHAQCSTALMTFAYTLDGKVQPCPYCTPHITKL